MRQQFLVGGDGASQAWNGHAPRSLVVNARKLEDGDEDRVRLLLAITDVTLARAEAKQ